MNRTRTRSTSLVATAFCVARSQSYPLAAGFTVQNLDDAYSLYKMANPEGVKYENEYQHG